MTVESDNQISILELLRNPDTRMQAAETVMGRKIREGETAITQHLIGIMEPEERLANLLMERASQKKGQ